MQTLSETSGGGAAAGREATLLILMLVATTSLSQFFRASTNVIAPELIRDLGLTPAMLGFANAAFFLALLAVQVPVGILFDRVGARITVASLAVVAVAGAVLHATIRDGTGLAVARFLIGIGHGGSFMASVFLVSRWFPRARWTTVLSWVWAGSMLGIATAGTPLAFATQLVGWRAAFLGLAGVSALVGGAFLLLVRDHPSGSPSVARRPETISAQLAGFLKILALPGLLRVLALQTVAYAVLTTVMGLWAGPYLHDVHGLDGLARGNALIAMAAGQTIGLLLIGPLDRLLDTRKWVAVTFATLSLGTLLALALTPRMPSAVAVGLLMLLAAVAAYGPVVVSHARSFYPEALAGRGVTTANMAQLAGCAAMPMATGLIAGAFPAGPAGYAPEAYPWIFLAIAGTLATGLAIYLFAEDARPSGAQKPAGPPEPTKPAGEKG